MLAFCTPSVFGQCARLTDFTCGFLLDGKSILQVIQYGKADYTEPEGVNNNGQVVGYYNDHGSDIAGFLYDHGVYTRISYSSNESSAYGINNGDHIVGSFYGYKNNQYTYFGYLKVGNQFTVLDYPPAQATGPNSINDSDVIVGQYYDSVLGPVHGFTYLSGAWTPFDYPGSDGFTELTGINNNGDMVGITKVGGQAFAFLYSHSQFTTISYPGMIETDVWGINSNDVVVGNAFDANDNAHPFTWSAGQFTDVTLPGNPSFLLTGINDANQVIGFVFNPRSSQVQRHQLKGLRLSRPTSVNQSSVTAGGR
jgi:probable HAF family extracellular repeat protein